MAGSNPCPEKTILFPCPRSAETVGWLRSRALLFAAAIVLALGGCAADRDQLARKGAAVPAGIDLSGQWHLVGRDTLASRLPGPEMLVVVFLETGEALRITQTDEGLFISFDRAVVEEYRFGELREVSVGPVVADRASGWDGDRYVIETLDADGVKLLETWRLENSGRSLLRTITILEGQKQQLDARQVFERG